MHHRKNRSVAGVLSAALVMGLSVTLAPTAVWAEDEPFPEFCAPKDEFPVLGQTVGELYTVRHGVDDESPGSFRSALAAADDSPGTDTIEIAAGVTVVLEDYLESSSGLIIRPADWASGGRAAVHVMNEGVDFWVSTAGGSSWNPRSELFILDQVDFTYLGTSEMDQFLGLENSLCASAVRDSTFSQFAGTVLYQEQSSESRFYFLNSVIDGANAPEAERLQPAMEFASEGTRGSMLIQDSRIVNNAGGGVSFSEEYDITYPQTIRVIRSTFENNGTTDDDWQPGGAFYIRGMYFSELEEGSEALEFPIVLIEDSVFRGNRGGGAGGVSIGEIDTYGWEGPELGTVVSIEGSSFVDNSHLRLYEDDDGVSRARHIAIGSETADPDENDPLVARLLSIENSTFESTEAAGGEPAPGIMISSSQGPVTIDHSTLIGTGVFVQPRVFPQTVELNNSLIDGGAEPALEIGAGPNLPEVTVEEQHMAYVGEPSGIPAGDGRLVFPSLADAQLQALAEMPPARGGPALPVRVPGEGSPLIDAAAASEIAQDQLGTARPQGPGAAPLPDLGAIEIPYDAGQVALLEDVTVSEGEDAVFTVTRSGGSDGEASVLVSTADGTAVAGQDYTATSARLSWAAGEEGPKTVSVPTLTDSTVEDAETFTVSLSEPTDGLVLGEPVTVTGTILDTTVPGTDGDVDADVEADADGAVASDADAQTDADAATDADATGDGGADATDATDGGTATAKPGTDPLANTGSGSGTLTGGLLAAGALLLGGLALAGRRARALRSR